MKIRFIDVLIIFSILMVLSFFVWYLIGDSPTIEQMVVAVVFPSYIFTFGIYKHLNEKFDKINERINIIGERLSRIEGKLNI